MRSALSFYALLLIPLAGRNGIFLVLSSGLGHCTRFSNIGTNISGAAYDSVALSIHLQLLRA